MASEGESFVRRRKPDAAARLGLHVHVHGYDMHMQSMMCMRTGMMSVCMAQQLVFSLEG